MQTIAFERVSARPSYAERRIIRGASPTELIYISTGTTVVSRSRIAGAVSREQFETAVAHLEERYGVLRAAVENGQFMERVDGRSSVEAWLPAGTASGDDMYARLLNATLDTRERIYAIYVIAEPDALDIFILSSHAVTDATSLIELHSCLAYLCDGVVRNEIPALERQPFPRPVDAAICNHLAALRAGRATVDPVSSAGAYTQIPMRAQPHGGPPFTHRLERVVIDADDVLRIGAAAHANGSSVHSLLLAALALAIRELSLDQHRQILVRSNVDLRRRLEPHVSTELVFSAISALITSVDDLDRPLLGIARKIFDDVHEGMADGSVFREYLNYPASFGSPQQAPVAISVSDMQGVKFHWPLQQLKVTGFEYALGWSKKYPNVSVSIYEGTLVATIVYVDEFIDPAVIRTVTEKFVKLLVSAFRFV